MDSVKCGKIKNHCFVTIGSLNDRPYKTESNFKSRKSRLTNNNLHVLKDLYEVVNGTPTNKAGREKERLYLNACKHKLMQCETTARFDRVFTSLRDEYYERWDRNGAFNSEY